MKTHLFNPEGIGLYTMCGFIYKDHSTFDPLTVDCKICWGAYSCNRTWWWYKRGYQEIPTAHRYPNIDDHIPEITIQYLRRRSDGGIFTVRSVAVAEMSSL